MENIMSLIMFPHLHLWIPFWGREEDMQAIKKVVAWTLLAMSRYRVHRGIIVLKEIQVPREIEQSIKYLITDVEVRVKTNSWR